MQRRLSMSLWLGIMSGLALACQPASFSPVVEEQPEQTATQEDEDAVAVIKSEEIVINQDAMPVTVPTEELVEVTLPPPPAPPAAPPPATPPPPVAVANPDRPISGVLCSGGSGSVAVFLSHYVSTTTLCADTASQSYWSKVYNDCLINRIAPGNGGSIPAVTVFTTSNCTTYVRNWITQWFSSDQYASQRGNYRLGFSETYCRPFGNGYYYVRQTAICRHCPNAFNASTGQCN